MGDRTILRAERGSSDLNCNPVTDQTRPPNLRRMRMNKFPIRVYQTTRGDAKRRQEGKREGEIEEEREEGRQGGGARGGSV